MYSIKSLIKNIFSNNKKVNNFDIVVVKPTEGDIIEYSSPDIIYNEHNHYSNYKPKIMDSSFGHVVGLDLVKEQTKEDIEKLSIDLTDYYNKRLQTEPDLHQSQFLKNEINKE